MAKPKTPVEYLQRQVMQNVGKDKAVLTRMQNITGDPWSIGIKTSKGDDYVITGMDYGATQYDKNLKRTVMKPGEDPIKAAARKAAETSVFGGTPFHPNEAAVADIESQLLNHPALKDRSIEERAAILGRVQDMTNYRGNMAKDVAEQTLEVLKQDPMKVDVLQQSGVIDEKQAKLLKGEAIPADELDAEKAGIPWAGMHQWLKDLPVQQHLLGLGAASAGVGAASIATANMLMQQGQQQQDYSAYAQAAQALHAY